jgi:putative ABC transport system substrate-binding protein
LIISLAGKLHLPAVYGYRLFVTNGGLICYGPDIVDQCRRAAGYADRILKGEQPGNLPVQEPTKFELVVNVKSANALGLEVPDHARRALAQSCVVPDRWRGRGL